MNTNNKLFVRIAIYIVVGALVSFGLVGLMKIAALDRGQVGERLGQQTDHPYTKYPIGGSMRIYEFSPEFDPSLTCIVKGTGSAAVNCYPTPEKKNGSE